MDISANLISAATIWPSWVLLAIVAFRAIMTAPWARLTEPDSTHVYFGAIVALMVLWQLNTGTIVGNHFHFLGATTLFLMFGWQFALFAISLLVLSNTLLTATGGETLALNILLMGALPIGISRALLWLTQRHLPANFFIYIFLNAFLAAALSLFTVGMTGHVILSMNDALSHTQPLSEFIIVVIMMSMPEGTLNGILMTGTVLYKPEWVSTFHDRKYFGPKT